MKQYFSFSRAVFAILLTAFVFGFSAFRQKEKSSRYSFRKEGFSQDGDTSRKRNRAGADRKLDKLDDEMKQLDVQMKHLDKELKDLDIEKIQKQAMNAVEKIDMEKIEKEVEESLKNADLQQINKDLSYKIAAKGRVEMLEAKKEIEKAKIQLQQEKRNLNFNSEKIKNQLEEAIKNSRESIENAKKEIQNVRDFSDALEKDGLIDKSKGYKIEIKDNELFIDGKKQSKEVSDKYRKYYKKKDYIIDMSNDVRI